MGRYSRFLTRFPYILIIIDVALVAICGPVVYWQEGLPSFDDPTKGFETKGTTIQKRRGAADLVLADIKNSNLTYSPTLTTSRRKRSPGSDTHINCLAEHLEEQETPGFVLEATDYQSDLMTVDMLKAICDFEDIHIRPHLTQYGDISEDCRFHSVPYYVSGLQNKTCGQIEQDDIDQMNDLLVKCSSHYFNSILESCYNFDQCEGIPPECYQGHHAVYKMLYALADVNFLKENASAVDKLTFTQIKIRYSWYSDLTDPEDVMEDYYLTNLEGSRLTSSDEKVICRAMDLFIFFKIFNVYVIGDLPFYALAMGLVLLVLILYMRSIILTMITLLTVIFTLVIGYFFYYTVFRFDFFPFMNLLAALLLIAVGADDVFIIRDIWIKYAQENEAKTGVDIEKIVSGTLSHGALSIFVTSLTTAAALFANFVSSVTVLKCFSVFAGTCILINFFFMITWVPAVMVIMEKAKIRCGEPCKSCDGFFMKLRRFSEKVWSKFLPALVLKVWPLWLVLFLGIGIGGIILSFVTPKLTLPKTSQMKVFYPEHPFEMYSNERYNKFQFELDYEKEQRGELQLRVYWGLREGDHSNVLNPDDVGHYEFDPDFNPFSQEGQEWLLAFIDDLLAQDFIQDVNAHANFMQLFKETVEGPCDVPLYPSAPLSSLRPCCGLIFPLNNTMAKICLTLRVVVGTIFVITRERNQTLAAAPIYDKPGTNLKAIQIFVTTKRLGSDVYSELDNVYKEFDGFVMGEMKNAPKGMNKGWWCSAGGGFLYYDLQKSLADGTYIGIGLSLGVGLLVLLFTSMNVFLTFYAIFTIGLAIVSTIGILVLAGWELGSFESLSITLAVGLSIDFTIHYGIAYKVAEGTTRPARITEALSTVGFALLMAAFTTFVAGAALMGGRVVGYRNFGVFLMTCMAMSWLFATFFFLPLCRFIGPLGDVGNLMYLFKCKCTKVGPTSSESDGNLSYNYKQKKATDLDFDKNGYTGDQRSRSQENGVGGERNTPTSINQHSPTSNHNNNNYYNSPYQRDWPSHSSGYSSQPHLSPGRNSYYSYESGKGDIGEYSYFSAMSAGPSPHGPFQPPGSQGGLWSRPIGLPRLGRTQSGHFTDIRHAPQWQNYYQH